MRDAVINIVENKLHNVRILELLKDGVNMKNLLSHYGVNFELKLCKTEDWKGYVHFLKCFQKFLSRNLYPSEAEKPLGSFKSGKHNKEVLLGCITFRKWLGTKDTEKLPFTVKINLYL